MTAREAEQDSGYSSSLADRLAQLPQTGESLVPDGEKEKKRGLNGPFSSFRGREMKAEEAIIRVAGLRQPLARPFVADYATAPRP
jgi:hypothetical protein